MKKKLIVLVILSISLIAFNFSYAVEEPTEPTPKWMEVVNKDAQESLQNAFDKALLSGVTIQELIKWTARQYRPYEVALAGLLASEETELVVITCLDLCFPREIVAAAVRKAANIQPNIPIRNNAEFDEVAARSTVDCEADKPVAFTVPDRPPGTGEGGYKVGDSINLPAGTASIPGQ